MKTWNSKVLVILILALLESGCQNKINGLYCFDHKGKSFYEYPCYYFNDSIFDYENLTDMGDFYGTGSWKIENRKLILDFSFMGARYPNYEILYEETGHASDTIIILIENEIPKMRSFKFNYRIREMKKGEIFSKGEIHGKGETEVMVPATVVPLILEIDNFSTPKQIKIEKPTNSKITIKFNMENGQSYELNRTIVYPIKRINEKSFRLKWPNKKYSLFKK